MLSRVAESLYWTGRLTERAGHVAQLLDVHLSLLLDSGQTSLEALARFWQQFLALCADPAEYARTEQPLVATKVVKEGDVLYRMAADVYGFATNEVLQRVVERNPGITDVNRILVGTTIRFPDVSDLRARTAGPTSRGQ